MALNIGREITGLQRMTVPELRRKYTEVVGENSTSRHKGFLVRRIIWHLQVQQEGSGTGDSGGNSVSAAEP